MNCFNNKVLKKRLIGILAFCFIFAGIQPLLAHIKTPIYPIVFPVIGETKYTDTFGAPRSGGRTHKGADIFGYKGQPLVASAPGMITKADYGERSGYMLFMKDDDDNTYYYIHLNNDHAGTDDGKGGVTTAFATGIKVGTRVLAGQTIGYLGDSGNAENTSPHLHYEIHPSGQDAVCPNNSLAYARQETQPRETFNYPKVTETNPYPGVFSPDNNGYLDRTTFNFTLNRDALITLRILNYRGEVARITSNKLFLGLKNNSVSWNGKGKNGRILPDGTYAYEIIASNGLASSKFGSISIKRGLLPPGTAAPNISKISMASIAGTRKYTLKYRVSNQSIVNIFLFNKYRPIKHLVSDYRKAGMSNETITGWRNDGRPLLKGTYKMKVNAINTAGETNFTANLEIK